MKVEVVRRRFLSIGAAAVVLLALAACDDPPFRDPSVETLRLTVGSQVVEVSRDGSCTGCPLVLTNGARVTAAWLNASGQADPIVNRVDFRLGVNIPSNSIGLAYSLDPADNFVAIFTATGTTSVPLNLTMWLRRIQAGTDNFPPTVVQALVN